jgi:uncharacterized protein (DUF58 family)
MAPTASRRRVPLLRRLLSARGRSLEITRTGWLFIALTLAVGFAAINSGSNLLHAVFGAQMALIIGSGIWSEGAVRRSQARRRPAGPLFAGAPALVEVQVHNTDPRRDVFSVSVEDDDRVDSAARCDPVFSVRLAPLETVILPSSVTFDRRGRHHLPPAVLATRFPFGLFVKRRELPSSAEVLVYPRLHAVPAPPRTPAPALGDTVVGGPPARVGEFHALREYRDGDDPRRLHWPATARLGRPIMREDESRDDAVVVLELEPGRTGDPVFEHAVEHTASVAAARLRADGVAVGLRYGDELVVAPGSGPRQRERVLRFLATVGDVA